MFQQAIWNGWCKETTFPARLPLIVLDENLRHTIKRHVMEVPWYWQQFSHLHKICFNVILTNSLSHSGFEFSVNIRNTNYWLNRERVTTSPMSTCSSDLTCLTFAPLISDTPLLRLLIFTIFRKGSLSTTSNEMEKGWRGRNALFDGIRSVTILAQCLPGQRPGSGRWNLRRSKQFSGVTIAIEKKNPKTISYARQSRTYWTWDHHYFQNIVTLHGKWPQHLLLALCARFVAYWFNHDSCEHTFAICPEIKIHPEIEPQECQSFVTSTKIETSVGLFLNTLIWNESHKMSIHWHSCLLDVPARMVLSIGGSGTFISEMIVSFILLFQSFVHNNKTWSDV